MYVTEFHLKKRSVLICYLTMHVNHLLSQVYSKVSSAYHWIWTQICQLSRSPPLKRCRNLKRRKQSRYLRQAANSEHFFHSSTDGCADSDLQFDLGSRIDLDCVWLKTNRFEGDEDLCDWLHVADRCPGTCNVWEES